MLATLTNTPYVAVMDGITMGGVRCAPLTMDSAALGLAALVRCAFLDRKLHPRMQLVSTHARVKLLRACAQWHSSREFTFLRFGTVNSVQTLKGVGLSIPADFRVATESTLFAMPPPPQGKDVSTLFTDVVKNMHTDNIELKKLVYLYIINYARSQPDKVNHTFLEQRKTAIDRREEQKEQE